MQQAVFKKNGFQNGGTYLEVYVPGVDIKDDYFVNGIANGLVRVDDGRTISGRQRGLLYAVFKDIVIASEGYEESKHTIEDIKELLKAKFCVEKRLEYFSLSDMTMKVASEFITFVLDFTFEQMIPLKFKTFEAAKDCRDLSYICFKNRVCVCCGRLEAVVHHMDTVGMGGNRTKVDHSKKLLIMVCPDHHAEVHAIGDKAFCEKHIVAGIFVDVATLKAMNVKGVYGEEADIGVEVGSSNKR